MGFVVTQILQRRPERSVNFANRASFVIVTRANTMDTIQPAELGGKLAAARTGPAARLRLRLRGRRGGPFVAMAPLGMLLACSLICAQVIPPASPEVRAGAPMDANR